MKKSLVLAMAMAMGVTASAYAANPFADVPAGHWAYDSVAQLAAAGVVEGYGDGFGGDKLMTRYEMAQVVAKAMAKGGNCDKLAAEFADELDALGVRVAKLEKKVDNVKITGNIRYSYKGADKVTPTADRGHGKDWNRFRTRLYVNGDINKNWKYTSLFENNRFLDKSSGKGDQFELKRAWLVGRVGGLKVEAGRMTFNYASQYNDVLDGATVAYKFGKVNVKGLVGKNMGASKSVGSWEDDDRIYAVLADTKFGKLDAGVNYFKLDNASYDNEIVGVKLGYPVAKGFKFTAEGFFGKDDIKATEGDKFGYELRLNYKGASAAKPGSWGAWVGYSDRPYSTYICPDMLNVWANIDDKTNDYGTDGYKGFDVGANYAFAKNIVGTVRYGSFEAREKSIGHNETLWADVTFTF